MHQPAPAHYHDPLDLKNIAVLRRNVQGDGQSQDPENRRSAPVVREAATVTMAAFMEFTDLALNGAGNVIPAKYAELIALAVALTTQRSECIERHAAEAKTAGATPGKVSETVMITAALRAGGGMAHGLMALKHFEHAEGPGQNEGEADEQKSA